MSKLLMGWDLQRRNILSSIAHILLNAFLVCNQFTIWSIRGNVMDEKFQLMASNVSVAIWIKLLPTLTEVINIRLGHGHIVRLGLIHKRINDNSDKQVQENL